MIATAVRDKPCAPDPGEARASGMVHYLRSAVLSDHGCAERFHTIFLDTERRYISDVSLGAGSVNALTLRMRDLFSRALSDGAAAIIVAHNHPSGDCRPSQSDIIATKRLAAISEALDIELVDHLIFTRDAVYSMRAGGDL
jgi:DNA repair protein RadC